MTFAERVYAVVQKIPKGQTRTYKDVAYAVGKPNAYRAVGTILSKNTDPKVPCHRVIRSDGKIGEYNQINGPSKRELLRKEGVNL
jgi:O-6-methylguanine DNA methyltransferase